MACGVKVGLSCVSAPYNARSLRKSIKIKGGTHPLEHFHVVRAETDGAETQLSPTTTPFDALNASLALSKFKSLTKNSEGCCFRATGWKARRDEGEYPWWIFD